jgi:NitT/TauT family transport system substrate-binding protein
MGRNKKIILLVIAVAIVVSGTVLILWLRPPKGYSGKTESLNFGVPFGTNLGLDIAQDQHFFSSNGLNVNVKYYPAGVATGDALLKGEVEIANAGEFPFVRRAFEKQNVSIIGTINRFTDFCLFARRDRGIERISDLKGRKIGVGRTTIGEFYLGQFLTLNNVALQDVTFVDIQLTKAPEIIANGQMDGVVTLQPYSSQIRTQMAGKVVGWSVHSGQPGYSLWFARNDWIRKNPEVIKRFLKSWMQVEDFVVRNPEACKAIERAKTNLDPIMIEALWSENQINLALEQSLITAMEDEARWMIKNNLTKEKQVPDFLNYIYTDGLKGVKPEAVNIIH